MIPNGNQRTDVESGAGSSLLNKWFKYKKLSKCTPRFRAQGDGFTLLKPTDSSKSWILAQRLGWPIRTSSVLSSFSFRKLAAIQSRISERQCAHHVHRRSSMCGRTTPNSKNLGEFGTQRQQERFAANGSTAKSLSLRSLSSGDQLIGLKSLRKLSKKKLTG